MAERKEYDYGVRTLAEQLYIFYGRTYEEVSQETGVSEGQLKRWGQAGEWRNKRDEYVKSKAQDLARLMGIKERILESLEAEIQPNTVHQLLAAFRQADLYIESKLALGKAAKGDKARKPSGLTDDAAEEIRQRILGIYESPA